MVSNLVLSAISSVILLRYIALPFYSVAFVSDLNKVNINAHELYMTSFDVESLYTNVPLAETIDIIVNKILLIQIPLLLD